MTRGLFIVLEGIDGSGTTTQAKRLAEAMRGLGRKVHPTKEPTDGKIGQVLREFLKGQHNLKHINETMALLFAADRLVHVDQEIMPQLDAGVDVISDRYVMSSWVYQGLSLPDQWIMQLNQFAKLPDLTIVLDLGEEDAERRRVLRGEASEIFETSDQQVRLRKRYLKLAEAQRAAIVDGTGEVEVVTERIMSIVRRRLKD